MEHKLISYDANLAPFAADLTKRVENYNRKKKQLLKKGQTLCDFANGHDYFGFHKTEKGWVYREWAPGAEKLYLTGDFCNWDRHAHEAKKLKNGVFELKLPGDTLYHGAKVLAIIVHNGQELERIPTYATRVVQEENSILWVGQVHEMQPFKWTDKTFKPKKNLYIYECHIGMAQEEGKVGTYEEFRVNVLPKIRDLGYNTLQIMAIMEHPYYASFGYQVTNFFAASSRFGMPEDLKQLINEAHSMGIAVLLDVVHSHASKNTREGLNQFDGTEYQFFHAGPKGDHSAWDTKCFNYDKNEVIHYLLSNLKFWQTEYHFDGFRFDGVTSMLYHDHGLGVSFTGNDKYFSMNTDTEAVTYLQLANELIREVNPNAITIAEDTSAMPGIGLPIADGGLGFDYRLAMGEPDMWIKLLKEVPDEHWDLNNIYYELAVRRSHEKVIGYCESHDQALVGDKTIMFRLCDKEMYTGMDRAYQSMVIDRGMALHKMLRLITLTLGGEGYLTFMGNEFGHPEWIDFPREGNGWSYHYCRRQWSLADNGFLRYSFLRDFDKDMLSLTKKYKILGSRDQQLSLDNLAKTVVYKKGGLVFAFNFHPSNSYDGFWATVPKKGDYTVVMSSDDHCYGGFARVAHQTYTAQKMENGKWGIRLYLPARTAIVLR